MQAIMGQAQAEAFRRARPPGDQRRPGLLRGGAVACRNSSSNPPTPR